MISECILNIKCSIITGKAKGLLDHPHQSPSPLPVTVSTCRVFLVFFNFVATQHVGS